ncbi:hypothetical protein HU200_006619 [Digitaria exilis]|uniref:F-box protein AT5G49610-like beta-propeller domain-containing protein n=1 Tax=Digitaria exilis TaxID=1010633 RepID=A0A835KRP1_9POAL|nr:hypothetical protein HU200_006619 [Digitaria exilis]
MPSFRPVRDSSDPDLAAAVRFADVFLTCVPGGDDASPGWRIDECRGGFLLLTNGNTEQVAVYNPLSRALDLFPVAPGEMSDGCRGKCVRMDSFLLSSDEAPGSFRVVSVCNDKSRVRAAVFSSGTREWQILPWSKRAPAQPSGKKYWLRHGRQANGKLYWSHTKQAYKVVLDTATMQFSFIDLPEHLKGKGYLYMAGEAKDGRPCIVSAADFTLSVWFRGADADGVEKWMLDSVIPLKEEVLGATKGSVDDHHDLKVLTILDGIVYLSTFETFIDAATPCWYLFSVWKQGSWAKSFRKRTMAMTILMSWRGLAFWSVTMAALESKYATDHKDEPRTGKFSSQCMPYVLT